MAEKQRGAAPRHWVAAAAAVVLALALSACQSSAGGATGGSNNQAVKDASAVVSTAMKNPSGWHGNTTPFTAARNKTLVAVSCSQATSGCSTVAEQAVDAAKKLGWTTHLLDGKSDPDVYNSDIMQAITLHADALIITGINQDLVKRSLAAVKKAGIVVVSAGQDNKPSPTGVDADVREPNDIPGQWIASWMIHDTKGHAQVLALNTPEYDVIGPDYNYFKDRLATCSGCKIVKEIDVNLASAATSLAQQISGILQANPNINYVYMPFSDLLPYVSQAIKTVNKTGQIKVADVSCQLPGPESLRSHGPETACVAVPYEWLGWSAMDLTLRLMAHQKVSWKSEIPTKLLTAANVFPSGEFWDGGYDFRSEYLKLWRAS